ncbi:MAG: FxLYD domain-containing protein [Bacteroidota bacterium]
MLRLPVLALVAALVLPLGACASEDPGQIEIVNLRLVRQADGYPEVSGMVINRTPKRISSADVGVTLFDDENLPMPELARLVVRNIEPGDSARFRQKLDVDARGAQVDYIIPN